MKKIQKPKINQHLEVVNTVEELLELIEEDEKICDKLIERYDIH